jgi:amino acid transporter
MSNEPPKPGGTPPRFDEQPKGLFRQTKTGYLVASEEASTPQSGLGAGLSRFKHFLVGRPLSSSQLAHERISKFQALAILASDALSSVAYATEEILKVFVAAGAVALGLSLPVAIAIVLLLAIVAFSYKQTIYKYPKGGGTYIVTKDNLGAVPALIAGSSLMVDYILTVAVSISSGVAAVTSAFPEFLPYTVPLAIAAILFITIVNLRGIRESAALFALPTYIFILSITVVIALGAWRAFSGLPPVEPVAGVLPKATEALSLFVILRAFASGCSAMTGTEAISDGVPAFQEPQAKNAVTTLGWMAVVLGVMFLGITLLAQHYGILANPNETVVSQIVRAVAGHSWFYYTVQASTALILTLAANTSFSDFPRLAYFLASDNFLPRQFVYRGDRLAFSTGIIALGAVSALLVLIFHASVDALIPLYAIGVFISFTFSQTSMAYRWWHRREEGWRKGLVINGVGAITTLVVAAVIMITKFMLGAWVIIVLLPMVILLMIGIARHYAQIKEQLSFKRTELQAFPLRPSIVVVPIASLNKATSRTLRYAMSLSGKVRAIHVTNDAEDAELLKAEWNKFNLEIPLIILESPYRSFLSPIMAYLNSLQEEAGKTPVTVVLSEFVPRHWWEHLLHNQAALRLKVALFFTPNVAVIDLPYHL